MKKQRVLPSMSAIRVFEAAARYEHFTKAGEELFMSQAAVSYQIKSLEEKLGVRLFLKTGRGVKLTPQGRVLADEVCGAFDRLRSGFGQVITANEKDLTIGCLRTFAYIWLQPRLAAFRALHPQINVRLVFLRGQSDALSDAFDVSIHSEYFEAPFRTSVPLLSASQAPVCSPAFAKAAGLRRPQDLLKQPLLGVIDFWQDWFAEAGVDAAGVDPDLQNFAVGNLYLEVGAAIGSMGVAIAPVKLYEDFIKSGKLVQPFDIHSHTNRKYWLTCSKLQLSSPKIEAFRTWILGQAKSHA